MLPQDDLWRASYSAASLELLPAWIGHEALAVVRRQRRQPGTDRIDAPISGVVHRSATKRCKACRKNRSGVQQIGVPDDPFPQAGNRLVEHRQHQPVLEVGGYRALVAGNRHRLAVLPRVEALAALAPEVPVADELDQDPWRPASEGRGEHVADMQAHVESDDVGELDR